MMSYEIAITCDGKCGSSDDAFEENTTIEVIRRELAIEGWVYVNEKDYCQSCSRDLGLKNVECEFCGKNMVYLMTQTREEDDGLVKTHIYRCPKCDERSSENDNESDDESE